MLKTVVILAACFVVCHCRIDDLLPYNLTASLMFLAEDLNQDGVITITELETEFAQYDSNSEYIYMYPASQPFMQVYYVFVMSTPHRIDDLLPYNLTASLMFLAEDLNQDGVITITELEAEFDQYDSNNNGQVSRHEYTEYICHAEPKLYNLAHYLYDDYDMDGDHHLVKADYDNFFAKLDLNGDGQVTPAEYIQVWEGIFLKYEYVTVHSQTHLHGHSQCH